MDPGDRLVQALILVGLLVLAVVVLVLIAMVVIYLRHRQERQERLRSKMPAYTLEELQSMLAEGHISAREYERLRENLYGSSERPPFI